MAKVVLRGLNSVERRFTRGSGTRIVPRLAVFCPAYPPVTALALTSALNNVVLPQPGSPTRPICNAVSFLASQRLPVFRLSVNHIPEVLPRARLQGVSPAGFAHAVVGQNVSSARGFG